MEEIIEQLIIHEQNEIIKLLIQDLQTEGYFPDMTFDEILESYVKRTAKE